MHNQTFMRDKANEVSSADTVWEKGDVQASSLWTEPLRRFERHNEEYMPFAMVLPLDAARREARSIINQPAERGFVPVVQEWMQLADGLIHFTVIWIKIDR